MAVDTAAVDRALGAIGTTFRLTRLYPPTHPAVQESLRQIGAALPGVAALGTVEWKVGATGLHWQGQHLLPRNSQVAELAELLYARGIRSIQANPGITPDHVLALFAVATGSLAPDDPALGRLTLVLGRRPARMPADRPAPTPAPPPTTASAAPQPAAGNPAPAVAASSPPPVSSPEASRGGLIFRPDVLPADVEARRAATGLREAMTPESQRAAVEKLEGLAAGLLASKDVAYRHGEDADFETELALDRRVNEYASTTDLPLLTGLPPGRS